MDGVNLDISPLVSPEAAPTGRRMITQPFQSRISAVASAAMQKSGIVEHFLKH
jgi:hypothetical protein